MRFTIVTALLCLSLLFLSLTSAAFGGKDSKKSNKNSPPVCVIQGNLEVLRQGPQTTFTLDATASFDPDGNPLTILWQSCPGSVIVNDQALVTDIIIDTPAGQNTVCGVRIALFDGHVRTFCRLFVQVIDTGVCLLIIDEDTIDNDISTIEQAAAALGIEPDSLINDDDPKEITNPPLRWNLIAPGDVVLLPGGSVDDEGLFALPPNPPFSITDFAAGVVPQSQLDPIPDVMPLRNHDLYNLVGLTCTAVVYDSDISMNYLPIQGNLQGARYGSFTFTVLEVVVPGSIPESQSDTSLYDLLVRVETYAAPTVGYEVTIRDHEPDSIAIVQANYSGGTLTVTGESNFAPGAVMTVSVEDFITEWPMTYSASNNRYEFSLDTGTDLDGRRVTISTDEGGAYNSFIN